MHDTPQRQVFAHWHTGCAIVPHFTKLTVEMPLFILQGIVSLPDASISTLLAGPVDEIRKSLAAACRGWQDGRFACEPCSILSDPEESCIDPAIAQRASYPNYHGNLFLTDNG